MTVNMRKVFSSHVTSIGYDDAKGDLHVRYQTGKTAIYHGVPPDTASMVMSSPSIGTALHQSIRGRFKHSYVEG